jgi:hypothetical protein
VRGKEGFWEKINKEVADAAAGLPEELAFQIYNTPSAEMSVAYEGVSLAEIAHRIGIKELELFKEYCPEGIND